MENLSVNQRVIINSDQVYSFDTDKTATIISCSSEYTDYLVKTEDDDELEVEFYELKV